jgi:hypothetical protein
MKVEVLEGLLHVMSPVVSGSDEHAGNHTDIRRITFSVDGAPVDIPVISGNSIRGQLRRLIMADMLERVGKIPAGLDLAEIEKMAAQSKGFARLWHALCSGGMLEQVAEKDSGYVDLAMKRSIRLALPPVSVLGTAIGNQMIQGKIDVAIARPCCIELKDSVPAKFRPLCVQPYRELEGTFFGTRKDDLHEEREEGDAATQMLYTYDYIAPGAKLYHRITLVNCNDIERAVVGRMIRLWTARPRLGGKAGTGHGEISVDYDSVPDDAPWLAWIDVNRTKILDMLAELEGGS